MKKTIFYLLLFAIVPFINSCQEDSIEGKMNQNVLEELNGKTQLSAQQDLNSFEAFHFDNNDTIRINSPFTEYLNKDFFRGEASQYFIETIPGHIFIRVTDNEYKQVSLKKFMLKDSIPRVKTVDKVYFNNRITEEKELEATFKFLNLNYSNKSVLELTIQDEVTAIVNEANIDTNRLKAIKEKYGEEKYDKLYFAKGVTVASISHRMYKETKFKKGADFTWLTASRNVFGTNEKFSYRKDLHLELVKLSDIVF
jgi:hypothetical protein